MQVISRIKTNRKLTTLDRNDKNLSQTKTVVANAQNDSDPDRQSSQMNIFHLHCVMLWENNDWATSEASKRFVLPSNDYNLVHKAKGQKVLTPIASLKTTERLLLLYSSIDWGIKIIIKVFFFFYWEQVSVCVKLLKRKLPQKLGLSWKRRTGKQECRAALLHHMEGPP